MSRPRTAPAAAAEDVSPAPLLTRFALDVQQSLAQRPRQLPSRYLYDELGSALFDAICRLPWYPITRAERRLLQAHRAEIVGRLAPRSTIVELGPGNGEKLSLLVEGSAFGSQRIDVHLVDLSSAALDTAAARLAMFDDVRVVTHAATYEAGLSQAARSVAPAGRLLVLFLGSNIGNFDRPAAEAFLRAIRRELRPGDGLLLGADLVKPAAALRLAYDDPLGVTAAFNRNLLVRVNRELDGDFAIDQFAHRAVWNAPASRVEMHLVARTSQEVHIRACAARFVVPAGDFIWTESSHKYRAREIDLLFGMTGFHVTQQWVDARDQFALTLGEAV